MNKNTGAKKASMFSCLMKMNVEVVIIKNKKTIVITQVSGFYKKMIFHYS
jgi:hypothetical protein